MRSARRSTSWSTSRRGLLEAGADEAGVLALLGLGLDASLVQPATQRFDVACLDLVAAGEENGITSTVGCVDEEA